MPGLKSKYGQDRRSSQPRPSTTHVTSYLITINPNISVDRESELDEQVTERLDSLNDFILEHVKDFFIFHNLKSKDGTPIEKAINDKPREWHMDRVLQIENQSFAIEFDYKKRKPHSHLHFEVTADTYLQVSREKVQEVAGLFFDDLGWSVSKINIQISAVTSKGQLKYLSKMMLASDPKYGEPSQT